MALNAWSKCGSPDKADRALDLLERMKRRHEEGLLGFPPGEHPCGLVINACAFSEGSPQVKENAFRIAVSTMKEMLESKDFEVSSTTFGWFLQACARLDVPEDIREENVRRAFQTCCDRSLVNEYVLNAFKTAASASVFEEMLAPAIPRLQKYDKKQDDLKELIYTQHLPVKWTRPRREPRNRREFDRTAFRQIK